MGLAGRHSEPDRQAVGINHCMDISPSLVLGTDLLSFLETVNASRDDPVAGREAFLDRYSTNDGLAQRNLTRCATIFFPSSITQTKLPARHLVRRRS